MSSNFICPNPVCTHVFDQDEVRGARALTCPECGQTFRFAGGGGAEPPHLAPSPALPAGSHPAKRGGAAPARGGRPPARRSAAPPAEVPVATPVRPGRLPAAPPGSEPPARAASPEQAPGPAPSPVSAPASHRRRRGRSRTAGRLLALGVILTVLGLLVGVPLYLFRDSIREAREELREEKAAGPVHQPRGGNYRLRLPGEPWQRSQDVERELGVGLAMARPEPRAWVALLVTDYKDRMPAEDEMLKAALVKLRGYFQGVEWEFRDEETLGGRPARRFVFQGHGKTAAVSGECLMLAHQGLAYWLFAWAPPEDDLAAAHEEWARVRGGFELLREREGWKGKVARAGRVQGRKAEYALSYGEDVWSSLEGSGEFDQVLVGREPDDPKNALKGATVSMVVLPVQAHLEDAVKEARAFVVRREKEAGPDVKIEEVPGKDNGGLPEGPVQLGTSRGQMVRLRVGAEGRDRFVALAVVPRPAETLVLLCECGWRNRETWEERFRPVLQSLNFER